MKYFLILLFSIGIQIGGIAQSLDSIPEKTSFYIGTDSSVKGTVGYFPDYDLMEFRFNYIQDGSSKITEIHLYLFDRWGNLLADTSENNWTLNELRSHHDVVIWKIKYVNESGEKIYLTGKVFNSWF